MTLSFRSRIFLALVGLVIAAQLIGSLAVLSATKRTVKEQAAAELEVGSRVFSQLMETRAKQLLDASLVVASDYGFKQAIGTQDNDTIASVLVNHGSRVRADLAMFVDLEGNVAAGSHAPSGTKFPFSDLLTLDRGGKSGLGVMGGHVYQLVVAPVMAPDSLGWACLGFIVDNNFAKQVGSLTSLSVSISSKPEGQQTSIVASSLAERDQRELALTELPKSVYSTPDTVALVEDEYLTMATPLTAELEAVLQTPMSLALAAYTSLRLKMIVLFMAALIVALVVARQIASSVTRPIIQLASAARRIAHGDYEQEVIVERDDEIGSLATVFNEMRHDISVREEQILHQSRTDALTELPNRTVAVEALRHAVKETDPEKPLAVLLLDINGFKAVNDSLGHAIGDEVLRSTAMRIAKVPREGDLVSRLDGDEFMILLADVDESRARSIARRICSSLEEPISISDIQVRVSATVGLAVWPMHGDTASMLLRRANIALYEAKQARQIVATYNLGEDERQQRRMRIVQDLPAAIRNGELSLCYQPKIELASRRIVEVEALARWIHPELGFVSPADFAPLAEQSGKVHLLTRWALTEAMNQARLLREQGIDIMVAVNLSALDLLDADLPDWILGALVDRDIPPASFGVEVTESAVMGDPKQAARALRRLRDHGLGVAIDDFGTGYSSLAHLQKLPVTELKIDRSFITPLTGQKDAPAIVQSIINLGHVMNLRVTAEGIEDEDTWWMLERLGCDKAQGYFMSRPIPADELTTWLQSLPMLDGVDPSGRARHRVFQLPDETADGQTASVAGGA